MTVPAEVIDAIKSRVDMVELVREHLPLKKAGANYSACCPFHQERTPSFTVTAVKGFYHCFGCGAHGDQIDWMVEYLGMPWHEAVARLAERAGVAIPENEDSERIKAKLKVSKILSKAANWMHRTLMETDYARRYVLEERKLTPEIAEQFLIGFSPKSLQTYLSAFPQEEIEVLVQAGLLGKSEDGRMYPKLGGRIIFPIRDAAGWVIGFSGRALGDAKPKYMNSPDSPFFSKRNEVFRPPEVQRATRRAGRLFVTEGYFDVISLFDAGFPNAVAGMGTATTPENMETMFALSDELVFCFDGDKAGKQAAWKALLASLPFIGTSDTRKGSRMVSFVFLPNGLDPDDFIRTHGKDDLADILGKTTPLSTFFIESYRKKREVEPMERHTDLMSQAARQLVVIKDEILRNGLAASLANIFDVPVDQVKRAGGFASRRAAPAKRGLTVQADALETSFLVNLLRRPTEAEFLPTDVELKIPGGNEIVFMLRTAFVGVTIEVPKEHVSALFDGTPFWPLVEKLMASDEADDSVEVNAKRIELQWVVRQIDEKMKLGDMASVRQLLQRKLDVQTQIERAFNVVAA